ncbi:MAG TPA: polysaccharide deacetylase family protein, partial [Thermoanaerobaculia bacterium]|nr:polysaccharide deacetylase family protein [Thermoanaerobaculia bacterium]
ADPALGAVYSSPRLHQGDRVWRVEGRQAADGWELLVYKGVQSPRAYRVEVLRRLGGWSARDPFEGRFFEDRLMLSRVARVAPVAYLPEILGNVRVLADSLSRRTPMRAAVAKLWILWLEANAAQRSLSVQLRGAFLRGRLTPRRRRPPERSWSVIIPVHDGAARLRRSLRSWMESDWSEVDGEILVVDDGSGEAIEEALAQGDPRIRLVRNAESRGAAWARNQGARLARGEMLFFSDSDHIVQPDVLSVHEHRHAEAGDTALVVGNVLGQRVFTDVEPARLPVSRLRQLLDLLENDPRLEHAAASIAMRRDFSLLDPGQVGMWRAAQAGAGADSWLWRWAPLILRFGETLAGYPHRWMRVSAGSLSVPARMFWDLGGFDEAMRSLEDWDLGARAQRSGATVICAPDAEPLHQVHPRDPRRQQENRKSARILRSKHPGLVRSALRSSGELRPPGADLLAPGTEDGPPEDRAPAGDGAGGFFAVTFDDGPHPFGTPLILEVLERYGAPATFFLLGREISRHRELCQRMVESGHEIGLHGWVHTPTTELTTREIAAGLARSAARLEEATGRRPAFARPPYGIATGSFLRAARSLGIQVASWHTSPRDWSSPGRIEMMKRLALAAVAGKVLLFHDGSGNPQDTADVVDWLLQAGRRFALQPLTLSAFAERAPLPPFADAPPQSDWPPPQV